ncbi:MAG TPA: hypothetical protein VFH63_07020 [candidate division Zixibacteria bacterium]|nr:hypothetical protein [candidate division Zixibacteria bacterium]
MPPEPTPVTRVESLDDPRTITLLTTEHWSLLSARALAYNEAFVRAGMFLTFLSMSFVALALVAQAMSFNREFLTIAALVLAFDFVVGLTTFGRINGANLDDLRANHGMARIRHAYTQINPDLARYFISPTHDDIPSVLTVYGPISPSLPGQLAYGLTTSNGMIGLIVAMVGGVLAAVVGLLAGAAGGAAIWIGVALGVAVFVALVAYNASTISRVQATYPVLFPAPAPGTTPGEKG